MFGTAYLPNKKPMRFGLYYKFPKDYFLQHLYMFKKVDEDKLLENKTFRAYYELRPKLFKFLGLIKEGQTFSAEEPVMEQQPNQALAKELN